MLAYKTLKSGAKNKYHTIYQKILNIVIQKVYRPIEKL